MEKGFYHPERGYWQTLSEPSESVVAAYPLGTLQVQLRPDQDYQYINGAWVYVEPEPAPYVASDLSPRRFEYLLAVTGLGYVWDAIQADLEGRDVEAYAQLAAQRSAGSFSQVKTLAFVAMFKPTADKVAPDIDLSDAAIKAAWKKAEKAEL